MADKVMEIRLDFDGLEAAARSMDQGAQKVMEGAKATERLAKAVKDPAFTSGPNQRLERIAADRKRAATLEDPGRKAAVLKDLDLAEFNAKRAKSLGEKRLAQGQAGLDAPGLLELFGDLSKAVKGLRSGNFGAVAKALERGIGGGSGRDLSPIPLNGKSGGPNLGDFAGFGAGGNLAKVAATAGEADAGLAAVAGGAEAAGTGLSALGPIGLAVGVGLALLAAEITLGVTILKGTFDAAKVAAERFAALSAAMVISGGSAGDILGLKQLGIGTGQAAGLGASLQQRIGIGSGSPFSFAAAGRYGVAPQLPRQLGGPDNEAANLKKILEGMAARFDRDPAGVRRDARQLGLEGALPSFNVSESTRTRRRSDASLEEKISADGGKAANDFNAALARIPDLMGLVVAAFGKGGLEQITPGLQHIGDALAGLAAAVERHPMIARLLGATVRLLEEVIVQIIKHITMLVNFLGGLLPGVGKGGAASATNPHLQALNANSKALNDLRAVMQATGGGPRAANAIPLAIRGVALQQQWQAQQMVLGGLGAFAL